MGIRSGSWGDYQACGALFKNINAVSRGALSQRRVFLVGPNPAEGYHFDIVAGTKSTYHSSGEAFNIAEQKMAGNDILVVVGKIFEPNTSQLKYLYKSEVCSVLNRPGF